MFHTFWPLTIHSSPSRSALRAEAGEVGTGAGLGEQLAPLLLAREHRPKEPFLHFVGAVRGDGGAGEVHEERRRVGRSWRRRRAAPCRRSCSVPGGVRGRRRPRRSGPRRARRRIGRHGNRCRTSSTGRAAASSDSTASCDALGVGDRGRWSRRSLRERSCAQHRAERVDGCSPQPSDRCLGSGP